MATIFGRAHLAPRCPCGYCRTEHGFCADHAARLAEIRADFLAGRAAKSRDGIRARSKHRPMCCLPGCFQDRLPGQQYCWEHEDEHAD